MTARARKNYFISLLALPTIIALPQTTALGLQAGSSARQEITKSNLTLKSHKIFFQGFFEQVLFPPLEPISSLAYLVRGKYVGPMN